MRILGIETSCDETAAAVLEVGGSPAKPRVRVRSNVVASQAKLHAKFGGVVPHLAKREHQRNLVPVLLTALRESRIQNLESRRKQISVPTRILDSKFQILNSILEREPELCARLAEALAKRARMAKQVLPLTPPPLDAIAVTVGPGLAPALWVGVNFSRALAYLWRKPIIPVNHLEGHIYTNLLPQIRENPKPEILNPKQIQKSKSKTQNSLELRVSDLEFPAIALLVSGGHTELVLMPGYGRYRVIGETLDDAAGEAFDKVAKMLGLGFPGGPIVSRLAERGDPWAFAFPRPMLHARNFDFSFAGLKTAVLYTLEKLRNGETKKLRPRPARKQNFSISHFSVSHIAASFEQAVVDVLVAKTLRAAREFRVKTVMIGGGVAANRRLRAQLGQALAEHYPTARYLMPDPSLTGDNALMIALAGWFNRKKKTAWSKVQADANLRLGR